MEIYGLDAMILMAAAKLTQPNDSDKTKELRNGSLILLNNLKKAGTTIIISTVALSELLVGIKLADRTKLSAAVYKRYFVKPLDISVAAFAADLWDKHRNLPQEEQTQRIILKVDVFIVATAKLAGVKIFYSDDVRCRTLATQAGMTARGLPTHSEDLLFNAELHRGDARSGLETE